MKDNQNATNPGAIVRHIHSMISQKNKKNRARAAQVVSDAQLVELARDAFINGEFQRAEWLIDSALELNRCNDQALELKADVCYIFNRNREAADYYCEVLNLRSERTKRHG